MGHVILSGVSKGMTKPVSGTPISEFAVGSTVKMNVGGVATDFLIVHQGLPSSMYDESCNGAWLLMNNAYSAGKMQWNSSDVNDYENSTIHSYLNGDFFNLFGSLEQSLIKQVKIPYRKGSGSGTQVSSGASGLSTKIFFLSAEEVSLSHSNMPQSEGAELSYFEGCNDGNTNSGADSRRIAKWNGTAIYWWLRSPYINGNYPNTRALRLWADGSWENTECSTEAFIRPALVLPSTSLVDKSGMVVA